MTTGARRRTRRALCMGQREATARLGREQDMWRQAVHAFLTKNYPTSLVQKMGGDTVVFIPHQWKGNCNPVD